MIGLTGLYVALTAFYVIFAGRTLKAILRQEKDNNKQFLEQIAEVRKSADAAKQSADATKNIPATIEAGNRGMMRAYLTVLIGDASYQERREGQSDISFEARPLVVNSGNTAARKIRIRIAADVLPIPIPESFAFPLPEASNRDAGAIGPNQTHVLTANINRFVPDQDVQIIKEGRDQALCVWGLVLYEDVFGDQHWVKFGQWLHWQPINPAPNYVIRGFFLSGQNDVD
jgi:hypothetical protein